MNILIPLGGIGKRFSEFGYHKPKPLIKVLGKEIIFWVLDSLNIEPEDNVYIPYNELLEYYNFADIIQSKYPTINLLAIPNTRGASETILLAIEQFGIQGNLMVLDGDTWYEDDILNIVKENGGNMVTYFKSSNPNPIYSYIQIENNLIKNIKEKIKISNNANSGCYVFESVDVLKRTILEIGFTNNDELYTSQVIGKMIEKGIEFTAVEINNFHVLGTPQQIIEFSKKYPSSPKRFCFDLDNTLVTFPKIPNDYTSVEPIHETINYLKKLKENGHTIIIYTARRMRTHSGNVGSVVADIGKTTIETLSKFEIPYDELYFGKPYAHYYIDDLMVDPKTDLNKTLGYYMEDVQPRHFNTIEKGKTFIKKSKEKKLIGEKNYYEWIQNNSTDEVKNLFPKLISHTDESIEIEFLDGLNFSSLYVNEILSKEHLDKLVNAVKILHQYKECEEILYKYKPLSEKFLQRMSMYEYQKYGITDKEVDKISKELEKIEKKGFLNVLIHGDCVFSNVIVNANGNIKFVDMRGMNGNEYTPYGFDLYDYAKIYQSIVGYDEILMDKRMKISYKELIKQHFESHFDMQMLNEIKIVTISLLFSLIPLHNEVDKYEKYIKLGKKLLYEKQN
jgi:capsule biosynthesis phosphatase